MRNRFLALLVFFSTQMDAAAQPSTFAITQADPAVLAGQALIEALNSDDNARKHYVATRFTVDALAAEFVAG